MASGFFAIFDDVALLLDDIATMSKIATKKTAGVLGDDLAVNAQKASGFSAKRELPILWAIAKGSFINKLIILPLIFLLSAYANWLITPILMIGGLYLAFEGAEKIYEYFFIPHDKKISNKPKASDTKEQILAYEKSKIKSAIITDFILSLEIVIIALSTVINEPMVVQITVVSLIAILATVGVYGLVALIVRMDDVGYKLISLDSKFFTKVGQTLINALPKVIRVLAVIGTIAMLLVAGGIYSHNIHQVEEFFNFLPSIVANFIIGLIVGSVVFVLVLILKKISLIKL